MAADTTKKQGPALRAAGASDEAKREAARLLGSLTSERKRAAAVVNGRKAPPGPGRSPLPLSDLRCTCGADAPDGSTCKSTCPRGAAYRRRQKAGKL